MFFSTLHGNGTSLKVKSHTAGKNLNPTWNERLVIPNVTLDQLAYSQLELQVVHTKSMFKLKSTETLGYTVLQLQNVIGTWRKVRMLDISSWFMGSYMVYMNHSKVTLVQ